MRFATLAAALSSSLLVSAVPTKHRRDAGFAKIDTQVVQFAETLERLESDLYRKALLKFDAKQFQDAGFSDGNIALETIGDILKHEEAHTEFLDATLQFLGVEPIGNCSFNFDPVLTDVKTFIGFSRVVEVVGIGAYLGGANVIENKDILAAASAIVTIEARHQSALNTLSGTVAVPQAFDTPLAGSQVVSLAAPFVVGCQGLIDIFPPNPPLAVANAKNNVVATGDKLTFVTPVDPQQKTFCQIVVGDARETIVLPFDQCTAPSDVIGSLTIFQTKSNLPLDSAAILKNDPKEILAGPAIVFIDQVDTLGKLVFPIGAA